MSDAGPVIGQFEVGKGPPAYTKIDVPANSQISPKHAQHSGTAPSKHPSWTSRLSRLLSLFQPLPPPKGRSYWPISIQSAMSAPDETTRQPDSASELANEQQRENDDTKDESQVQAGTAGQTGSSKTEVGRSGVCGVCNENPGKYKCPRCRMP